MENNFTEISVGEARYVVGLYNSTKSLNILIRLSRIAGIPLFKGASAAKDLESLSKMGVGELFAKVSEGMEKNLDPELLIPLIRDILSTTQVAKGEHYEELSKDTVFNRHFQGNLAQMFELTGGVLSYQYADLKNALGGFLIRGLKTLQASMTNPPTTNS